MLDYIRPMVGGKSNFSIDGTVMENGPSDIALEPAQPNLVQLSGGGWVASPRDKGARITVRWGDRAADVLTMNELNELLTTTLAHTIAWTDPDGTAQSYDVVLEPFSRRHFRRPTFREILITFSERPG